MKTWATVDKSGWKRGEWDNEPDKVHWVDEDTGLDCLIVRGPSGALCGYVGVPPTHPWYAVDYEKLDAVAHGGLTFSGECRPNAEESTGICHPKDGAANEHVWWVGFDCAHLGDVAPAYDAREMLASYRDIHYVTAEVASLARQAIEAQEVEDGMD